MAVRFDTNKGSFVMESDECEDCGEPFYTSGCEAPDCNGNACTNCGTGCDLDFLPREESRCWRAIESEDNQTRLDRANQERAAFGLPPLGDAS